MKWFRVEKENAEQPQTGSYKDWKEILAEEGRHQCVYCAVSEAFFGGIRNFHVEHYRPKSLLQFRALENDIRNLFYACPICNTFKGDDWPCDPSDNLAIECYADPSTINYTNLFLSATSAEVVGANIAARYMVWKLFLNRPQLILERRHELVYNDLHYANQKITTIAEQLIGRNDAVSQALLKECLQQLQNAQSLVLQATRLILYTNEDVRR